MNEQRTCVKCRKRIIENSYHECGECRMGPLHYPCMLKHWEETGGKKGSCRDKEPTAHLDWVEARLAAAETCVNPRHYPTPEAPNALTADPRLHWASGEPCIHDPQ